MTPDSATPPNPEAAPRADCVMVPREPTEETVWLIERGQAQGQQPTLWWNVEQKKWCENAHEATRFYGPETANLAGWDAHGHYVGKPTYCVTEHVFLAAAPKDAVSPTGGEVAETVGVLNDCASHAQQDSELGFRTAPIAERRLRQVASLIERLWRERDEWKSNAVEAANRAEIAESRCEGLANEAEEHLLRANQEQGKRKAAESSLAAARETIEKLRLDAERYRWLRDKSANQYEHPIVVNQIRAGDSMKYIGPMLGSSLDTAIDAAKQTPEASGG